MAVFIKLLNSGDGAVKSSMDLRAMNADRYRPNFLFTTSGSTATFRGDHCLFDALTYPVQDFTDGERVKGCYKIEVLGKPAAAIAPADGCPSLKDQVMAARLHKEMV